jgi:hypothetical protein
MNVIEATRQRLVEAFSGGRKLDGFGVFQTPIAKEKRPFGKLDGFGVFQTPIAKEKRPPDRKRRTFRPTANDMPRLPASNIPTPRPRYDHVGRPPGKSKEQPLFRKRPRNIWDGWL